MSALRQWWLLAAASVHNPSRAALTPPMLCCSQVLFVGALWATGGSPLGPPPLESYGDSFDKPLWLDWTLLGGFALVSGVGTLLVPRRKVGGPR